MYRESPYTLENQAYIFDEQNTQICSEESILVNEISKSINSLTLQSPQQLMLQKKKISVDPQQFNHLFHRVESEQKMKEEYQEVYCGVCTRNCIIAINSDLNSNMLEQNHVTVSCKKCLKWICKQCIEICYECNEQFCKFCTTVSYQKKGDLVLCDKCYY